MFITALWALEQEYNALMWMRRHPSSSGQDWSDLNSAEQLFMGSVGVGWLMGHTVVAASPYTYLFGKSTQASLYLAEQRMEANYIRLGGKDLKPSYAHKRGGIATRHLGGKYIKTLAGRKTAAKIGARFIPYVGWGLLALDAWSVGKWIGNKWNPFDD